MHSHKAFNIQLLRLPGAGVSSGYPPQRERVLRVPETQVIETCTFAINLSEDDRDKLAIDPILL